MNKQRFHLLLPVFLLLWSCSTTDRAIHINNPSSIEQKGIAYALPRTQINIEVTVQKTDYIKGPYASYAKKLLGIQNVITSEKTEYSIRDLSLFATNEPDPDQYYFIPIAKRDVRKKRTFTVELDENGCLKQISMDVRGKHRKNKLKRSENFEEIKRVEMSETKVAYDKVDNSEFVVFGKNYFEKNEDQRAEEAAAALLKIRDDRMDLVNGSQEVNYPKESIEFMEDQLSKMEQSYLELFVGKEVISLQQYHFTFLPNKDSASTLFPLFRFSENQGLLDLSKLVGDICYIQCERKGYTDIVSQYLEGATFKKGIYYRIPEQAQVSLIMNKKVQTSNEISVLQYGNVAFLPFLRNNTMLYNSGALKSVHFK